MSLNLYSHINNVKDTVFKADLCGPAKVMMGAFQEDWVAASSIFASCMGLGISACYPGPEQTQNQPKQSFRSWRRRSTTFVSTRAMSLTALARCSQELAPIRGMIQGAMVLHDVLFERMSHEDWVQRTLPKVQRSWNLHQYLPRNLDFFIMPSSVAGVFGNQEHAN
jgi:hypothetical protein